MKAFALVFALAFAASAAAKEHDDYQKGTLVRMDSSSCGMQEKGSKTLAGEILGTDAQSKKSVQLLCQDVDRGGRSGRERRVDDRHRERIAEALAQRNRQR